MKKQLVIACFIIGTILLISLLTQGVKAQPYKFETYNKVDLKGAKQVEVDIRLLAGEMNLMGEAISQLLIGEYLYDDPDLGEPIVKYIADKKEGFLKLSNKEYEDLDIDLDTDDEIECIWNLQLNKNIPLDLDVKMGVGAANINLEDASLSNFNFSVKAGEINVNLKNTSVPKMRCKAIAADATFDLSGKWENDLHAYFKGGVGNLNLELPKDYNLHVEVSGIIGDVDTYGLKKMDDYYTRAVSEDMPTLYIDISGGIGSVFLRVVE